MPDSILSQWQNKNTEMRVLPLSCERAGQFFHTPCRENTTDLSCTSHITYFRECKWKAGHNYCKLFIECYQLLENSSSEWET